MAGQVKESATAVSNATVSPTSVSDTVSVLGRFLVLRGAMPELWVTFGVKFLAVAAYQVMNLTLVLWLSSDFGYSDKQALGLVATWSILMTVFTLLVGSLTDALGLRKTFLLGVVICVLARSVMTFTTVKWLALAGGLVPLAVGEALGTPVLVAAVRRYSTTAQRSISFSFFYVIMNCALLLASYTLDWVRQGLGEHGHLTLPLVSVQITTYRALFLVSLLIELTLLPIIYFGVRPGAEATDEGVRIRPEKPRYPRKSMWTALVLTVRDTAAETGRNFAALAREPGVFRLVSFLMLIAFLKFIMMHMYYVFPTLGIRELGQGAPVGRLWGINSALIIVLVPIVGVFSQKVSAYRMVVVGAVITAASVFVMIMPLTWFESVAGGWTGHLLGHWYLGLQGSVHPYYLLIATYILLFSVGEAFYSPRVYEYAAAIAPPGKEASYASLSYLPFFLGKLLVGTVSGTLLAAYCPETGPRDLKTMWLIVALIATAAPVGLIGLRRWIRVQEAGREG